MADHRNKKCEVPEVVSMDEPIKKEGKLHFDEFIHCNGEIFKFEEGPHHPFSPLFGYQDESDKCRFTIHNKVCCFCTPGVKKEKPCCTCRPCQDREEEAQNKWIEENRQTGKCPQCRTDLVLACLSWPIICAAGCSYRIPANEKHFTCGKSCEYDFCKNCAYK